MCDDAPVVGGGDWRGNARAARLPRLARAAPDADPAHPTPGGREEVAATLRAVRGRLRRQPLRAEGVDPHAGHPGAYHRPVADGRRPRVLVVEDDAPTREFLEDALALEGYRVRAAPDGAAGLAVLRAWRPDAIVLDLVMPHVDGRAFRAAQRALPAADVPVLLISATWARELERIARDLGAAAWLAKPFGVDDLLAAVGRLTRR